jgi:hypothetical protein
MQLVTNIPSLFTVRCNRCNNEFFRGFVESSTPNAIAANYDVPASGEVTPERAVGCVFRPEPLLLARNNLGSPIQGEESARASISPVTCLTLRHATLQGNGKASHRRSSGSPTKTGWATPPGRRQELGDVRSPQQGNGAIAVV